jgi:hypothetical protein
MIYLQRRRSWVQISCSPLGLGPIIRVDGLPHNQFTICEVGKYSGVSSELFHRKKSKASNRLIWDLMKIRLQNLRFQNIIRSVVTSCSSGISMAVYRSLRFPNPNSM